MRPIVRYRKEEIIEIIESSDFEDDFELYEILLEKGIRDIEDIEIIEKIIEKKGYKALCLCSAFGVLEKVGEKTVLEIMIEESVSISCDDIEKLIEQINCLKEHPEILDVFGLKTIDPIQIVNETIQRLYKNGKLKQLSELSDELFLTVQVDENKNLVDALLEAGMKVHITETSNSKIIKSILNHKKTEYYRDIDPYAVFEQYDENNTFMDIIMQHKKEDNGISIRIPRSINRTKARIIIEYVRHGFKGELGLMISNLLERDSTSGQNLLDFLLDEDRELTLTKVISEKPQEDPRVKAGLMVHDFKGEVFTAANIRERFEKGKLEEYRAMPVTEEQEQLLNKLREVLSDEKSTPELVEMIVLNYRRLFAQNNPCAYEVKHIIEMKERDKDFSVVSPDRQKGNSYNSFLNSIEIQGLNVKAFNHEIGHALFENVSHRHVPEEFIEILERIRSDESHLKKVFEHSLEYRNAKATIRLRALDMIDDEFKKYVTEERMIEIDRTLRQLGLSSSEIKKLFGKHERVRAIDFVEKEKEVRRKECESLLLENLYYNLTSVSDILDAIYAGKYIDGRLEYNGRIIKGEWGHGQEYYMIGTELIFNEILADYSRIIKSPNPKEGIEMLTYYVGKELVDFLHRYYQEHILDVVVNEYKNNNRRENERKFRI